ncbi:Amidase [Paramuricea clavata]|uniref:Amidase n=1 Tax=Paramuricea clavata TaxID=317549 RepID=A0A6S7HT25_PARCT|nr:Amidase [Paramuricea clavata]
MSVEELKEYQEVIANYCETTFQRIYNLPEPKLPVKYARKIGNKPAAEENRFNAWYWKCDISGAPNGKLHGKTIAMKDNISVAGIPMMNGSQLVEGYIPDIDASVVTRVLDEGGRILGKAVCENLCFSGGSFTAANGLVRNPWDPSRMSGGSSSGCAVLVANKDVDMAIGGDQGGSIRMPAAACGIVGLKPTFGLVPYTGIIGIEPTIDHTGPMAQTVYDTALLLEAIAGYDDGLDHRQPRDLKIPSYTKELSGDIKGLRVGLLKEGFDPSFETDVNDLVRKSAARLSEKDAVVEEVSIPWHLDGRYINFLIHNVCIARLCFIRRRIVSN